MNKNIVSCKGKEIELMVDHNLFAKMGVIAQCRKLDKKEVVRHELGPFRWATCDGMLRKTNKAVLSKQLEKLALPVKKIESNSACIINAMSLVQKAIGNNKTLLAKVMSEGKDCA